MTSRNKNLIWIDLEMTGLNPSQDRIIEIAIIVTDPCLEVIAQAPVLAIWQPTEVLDQMDEWNQLHHTRSGLIERVKHSAITEEQAEIIMLDFLKNYVAFNKSPMCGNSICQDRRFLHRYMPNLEAYFHYRNLDVSTLKELAKRWAPLVAKNYKKTSKHMALDDIKDSIDELKYYREFFIKMPETKEPSEGLEENDVSE